jgi:hypothetical protein
MLRACDVCTFQHFVNRCAAKCPHCCCPGRWTARLRSMTPDASRLRCPMHSPSSCLGVGIRWEGRPAWAESLPAFSMRRWPRSMPPACAPSRRSSRGPFQVHEAHAPARY